MNKLILSAVFVYHGVLFAQSDSARYYFNKGLEEKEKGRRQESLKQFEKAYWLDSTDKTIVNEVALAFYDLRRYKLAIEKYKKLEQLGDNSTVTYTQLMLLSFKIRNFDDAIKYANLLKKVNPAEKVAYYIGKANFEKEYYGDAIKYLEAAAKEDETNAEVPYMIAQAYTDMFNYKQAIPYYQKAIALKPSENKWIYEMALVYYALNDDKNSLKYMLEAGEKGYARSNNYLENLGIVYLNTKKVDEGIKILKEALQRRPTDVNLLNMLAEAHYEIKKYNEAIDYWDQILSLDKQNASALYMIGLSYQRKGEKDKGMALCDKAIEMDPSLSKNKKKIEMTQF